MVQQLFHLLMHIGKLLHDRMRKRLGEHGLHHGQGRVLVALAQNGALSQIEIAKGLHIQRPTVTTMIQRMAAAGLVKRISDPKDRRVLRVRLTAKGKTSEKTVRRIWGDVDREIIEALPADQRKAAREILLQIRNNLGGQGPKI